MENKIAEKIVERINPIIPIAFNMQERKELPYSVFTFNTNEAIRVKSGIIGYDAEVLIYIIAEDENSASDYKQKVINSLEKEEDGWQFIFRAEDSDSDENSWAYQLTYLIKQG